MFIPIWFIIIATGAEDYASEILYPDDLIPIEDLEGKFQVSIFFSNFELRSN